MISKTENLFEEIDNETDTALYILLVVLFTIAVIGLIVLICFVITAPSNHEYELRCETECEKFDYDFYKIDSPGMRLEDCWCLDKNNKPTSIGALP